LCILLVKLKFSIETYDVITHLKKMNQHSDVCHQKTDWMSSHQSYSISVCFFWL